MDIVLIIVVLFIVFFIVLLIIGYNSIVSKEQNVYRAFSDIDIYINRIAQQLPNLVNAVKGSALFEQKTLTAIAQAYQGYISGIRSSGNLQDKVQASSNFFGAIYPIILQLPNYPQLQSIPGFSNLMHEITVAIDKITYARQYYNQAVEDYNIFISKFPWVIVAKILGKKPHVYFEYKKREEVSDRLESGDFTQSLTQF